MMAFQVKSGIRRMSSIVRGVVRRRRRAAVRVSRILTAVRTQARIEAARILGRDKGGMPRESGQGTTEYAILVGVLVVIAILAITVFRPRLQELWQAISDGINSL